MKITRLISYEFIIFFMMIAIVEAAYHGWFTLIQMAPWLPRGYRVASAYPYSLLIFGSFGLLMVRKFDWLGVFIVALLIQLWEMSFTLQPNLLSIQAWPIMIIGGFWPGYTYLGTGEIAFLFFIILYLNGIKTDWKRLLLAFMMMYAFAIPASQLQEAGSISIFQPELDFVKTLPYWLEYVTELASELFAVATFLLVKPFDFRRPKRW